MDISQKILSDIVVFNKYAKYIPELGRRENWRELCLRNMGMHMRKFPHMVDEIEQVYNDFVLTKKVLPSMRSMQFGGRPIELANNRMFNCFSPDTRFITTRGTYSFDQFIDGDEVEVMTHKGNIKKAVVKNYGKQDLYEVVFRRGRATKTVHVTKNHRWILYNGSETTNLKVGDSIAGIRNRESFDFDAATPFEKLYWCYGYVFGDGSKIKDRNGEYKHTLVRLCGDDKKYLPRFEEVGFASSTPLSAKGDPFVYTGTYLKTAPDPLKDSPELISAFVDGCLCADAYKNPNWYYNSELSKYVSIQSSDDDHIELLKNCLESSGYFITTEKNVGGTVTNLGTYRDDTTWFGLSGWVGKRIQNSWKVESISMHPISVSDVWCLEVEDDHSFVLSGGLVTGNCAYTAVDHPAAFWEAMFLLLGGSGVGFSVQFPHVAKLPAVVGPTSRPRRFLVGDSIEGWADAIKVLMRAYFEGKSDPDFDYRDIRPKGARLITSGGKAPGPEPLRICVEQLRKVLNGALGRKLSPLECHDMMCHIADAVLSGGIRRAALISLFSINDLDMLSCKTGDWWELNPQRGRANNSVVLERGNVTEDQFMSIWQRVQASGCGEPGFFWTNDINIGTNPCCVPGDQLVSTDKGLRYVKDLVNTPFNAIVDGNIYHSTGFWNTGSKPVYKVTTARGYNFKATEDHRILISSGEWVELQYLQAGDSIVVNNNRWGEVDRQSKDFALGWVVGSVWGDGGHNPQKYPSYARFWGEEQTKLANDVSIICDKLGVSTYVVHNKTNDTTQTTSKAFTDLIDNYLEAETKAIKDNLITGSRELIAGFISGAFDADGTITGSSRTSGIQLQLAQSSLESLLVIQRMLNSLGVVSSIRTLPNATTALLPDGKGGTKEYNIYNIKQQYRLDIGRDNVEQFATVVGFMSEKQQRLDNLIATKVKSPYKTQFTSHIVSIDCVGVEEVFDCNVPMANRFDCNGVVVHNCEISLKSMQFCNLTEVNVSDVTSQEDLDARCKAASFIGTLQAGYTNFHYLRPQWIENTEKDALIGVGQTGIGSGRVLPHDLKVSAEVVKQENERVAGLLGINVAARCTTIKPSGTSSLTVGSSSGIHAWHNDYYIRRMRVGKNEALYHYMKDNFPALIEDCVFKPHLEAVMMFPQKAPEGAILRTEPAINLLKRVRRFNQEWVHAGYREGANHHNVSCTISIRPEEWDSVGEWMWNNKKYYTGISVLPYDTGTYPQQPFSDCTKAEFEELYQHLKDINLDEVKEEEDNTKLTDQAACAGNVCELNL